MDPTREERTLNQEQIVARLARALQFRTISAQEDAATRSEFQNFHAFLQTSFPSLHKTLERIVISEFSVIYKWQGRIPTAPPLLFLAHHDVVPAVESAASLWRYPPFEGRIEDGRIWGRGALDDKSALMGMLEAVETLTQEGFQPGSTIYLATGHDEELAGPHGARQIADYFRQRKIRFQCVLDEGQMVLQGVVPGLNRPVALIGAAQKKNIRVKLKVNGPSGHSSISPVHTAIGILSRAIIRLENHPFPSRLCDVMRSLLVRISPDMPLWKRLLFSQASRLWPLMKGVWTRSPVFNALVRTTMTVTLFHSGERVNVLPHAAEAQIHIRLLPGDRPADVLAHIRRVIGDPRVELESEIEPEEPPFVSSMDSALYRALETTIQHSFPEALVAPGLVTGATDARYYYDLAESIYYFRPHPVTRTEIDSFHGDNERIAIKDYLHAILFWKQLFQVLAARE